MSEGDEGSESLPMDCLMAISAIETDETNIDSVGLAINVAMTVLSFSGVADAQMTICVSNK